MQAVLKMPDNAISQPQAQVFEYRIKENIQWKNLAVLDVISNLPTKATAIGQHPHDFMENWPKTIQVVLQLFTGFVFLAYVVGR